MAKVTWKGSTMLAPIPVVAVSCGNMESANIITVAWTGIINSNPPKVYVSIRPERHSHAIISQTRELCINLTDSSMLRDVDWCGIRSGRDVDKFAKTKLSKEPCTQIACPQIAQSPLTLECKVTDIIKLGSHDMFICDVVAINADETLVDESGKLNLSGAGLVAFAHGEYYKLGKKLGKLGYSHAKAHKKTPPTHK